MNILFGTVVTSLPPVGVVAFCNCDPKDHLWIPLLYAVSLEEESSEVDPFWSWKLLLLWNAVKILVFLRLDLLRLLLYPILTNTGALLSCQRNLFCDCQKHFATQKPILGTWYLVLYQWPVFYLMVKISSTVRNTIEGSRVVYVRCLRHDFHWKFLSECCMHVLALAIQRISLHRRQEDLAWKMEGNGGNGGKCISITHKQQSQRPR